MTTPPHVFVILTGVSGNLGDAVIRRRVLEWSRGLGTVHAYVGRTTDGWVEQLQMRADETVYRASRRREWLKQLVFGRGRRVLVFDPGEVPLGTEHLKSELMFLAIVIAVRLRGGIVFRPPRAVGDYSPLVGAIYRLSSRFSQITLWRDGDSMSRMRVGVLSPDTAFAEPNSSDPEVSRDVLLVSMRGKRALPSDPWFDGIAAFAREAGLRIVAVSQVDEDEQRSAEIATRFGADLADYEAWGDRSDLQQEQRVRELYKRCAIVVSDRLHVLILSAQAGAVPTELAPTPKAKVRTHFATIGFNDVSLDTSSASAEYIAAFLRVQAGRADELATKLAAARNDLSQEVRRFRELVSARSA
ncbi:polysaccharide pyruvyl transferase family protein [Microbacterium binotii]|uniref:polysaccharide pyruvyl transferase family protein n=1 Tax=Microbacterium binotii TaxID=462710 RepID=UPI001F2436CC|nr:polysaccharide pyruvyl transferase family protein [Microbacterium binotii]UIN30068.1 polysaccharide pyruvyl transferase family protein [Microbacterium binotii]